MNLPKPNTQALSWFYSEYKNHTLRLDAKYQRNPIWSIGQKCFLIDSLISGAPIPQVYINIISEGTGSSRKTIYEVVDGQQRLRSIIEFMLDDFVLVATTATSYPVSDVYKPHIGKRYSELPTNFQDMIWNYPLAVQELRDWNDEQIRSLFRRLNYVVEKLNKQEMRHSQYFGEFVNSVEKISDNAFWDDIQLFSRRDSQRMKDIEFISELFILVIDGPQDQQKTLDDFYAKYDVEFIQKKSFLALFNKVIESLNSIADFIKNSRFIKKADFYALFGAISIILAKSKKSLDLSCAKTELKKLDKKLSENPTQLTGIPAKYYSTVIEGANKLAKREERIEILKNIIEKSFEV